ncbi:MAG TPA: glycosyltransferase [Acidimicrobiales bacterium]|nr:glycosyltransferase [Acidimicrobiales bacterium]
MRAVAAPTQVAAVELGHPGRVTDPTGARLDRPRTARALVLVRLHGHPVALVVVDTAGGFPDPEDLLAAGGPQVAAAVRGHLRQDRGPARRPAETGLGVATTPACLEGRRAALARARPVTVVVATRDRPAHLARCLDALVDLDYPTYEIVVVDNDPTSEAAAAIVAARRDGRIRYVREPRRGLAAAHNTGLAVAEGDIVAFTDDDVVVDGHWLAELATGFDAADDVACVTGLILPAELETPAQVLAAQHGAFAKGLGARVVDRGIHRPHDPLFPFAAGRLGSGANMAFHADTLRGLGGFDPATGAGTPARGGDDLAAFLAVVADGHRLAYRPSALVWHHHRRDPAAPAAQAASYGTGLGAYLASSLLHRPRLVPTFLRLVPAGLAEARASSARAALPPPWREELARLERRGLILSPVAYGLSRWRTRGAWRPSKAPGR